MTDNSLIRSCYKLFQSILRNAAYYRGAASIGNFENHQQFAIVARNNFLDAAFLDWCKLFSDGKGKHHWKKVLLPNEVSFMPGLLSELGITDGEFVNFSKSVTHYRDKVIAHADIYTVVDIQNIDFVIISTIYMYTKLRQKYGCEPNPVAPNNLHTAFSKVSDEGRVMLEALLSVSRR